MKALKCAVLLLFLLHLAALSVKSQKLSFETLSDSIQKIVVDNNIPSVAVAVAKDGEIIWEEGFGWADREKRRAATPHTVYSLASISKPMTATGLMVLVERGVIDLDRPINEYLGQSKLIARIDDKNEATVRHVASHRAGLPLHYNYFYEDEPYRRPSMDETIRRYGNLVTAPGERYQYSNLGYGLLDYIISRTAKVSFAEFMRTEVFLPLGMTRTSVGIGSGLEGYIATRYAPDGIALPLYEDDSQGAGANFSSAHDLIRFAMFHLKNDLADQKKIISDESINQMTQALTQIPAGENTFGYGIGWAVPKNNKGLQFVMHLGGMDGVSTVLIMIPEENLAITVLSNANTPWPIRISSMILDTIQPDKGQLPGPGPPSRSIFTPENSLIGKWEGLVHTYQDTLPVVMEIKESGDVHVKLGDQLWTLLNNVRFENEFLKGVMTSDIKTDDANRRPNNLHLDLKLRGNVLNGSLISISRPANRVGNGLAHWIELSKQ